jgi:hypothetical protein
MGCSTFVRCAEQNLRASQNMQKHGRIRQQSRHDNIASRRIVIDARFAMKIANTNYGLSLIGTKLQPFRVDKHGIRAYEPPPWLTPLFPIRYALVLNLSLVS